MYPNLYYAFKDLFGVDWPFLRVINSFGFFVALSFILAAVLLTAELRRKSRQGLLQPTEISLVVGKPASLVELILNFLLGFVFGYKILGLFLMNSSAKEDPQAFIFSGLGSWPAGLVLGLVFAGFKWWEKHRQKLPQPEERKIRFWPHDRVGEITILALVFGLLGAKLFDIFENWGDFLKHPSEYILSPAGLTFYGGLICAALAIWWYARRHKIGIWHLNDAVAPSLMLAYAVGRIGCQVAGDGDWGIYNAAYRVDDTGHVAASTLDNYVSTVHINAAYFQAHYGSLDAVPHAYFPKPGALGFLPDWLFAYQYPHNVNEIGVPIPGCDGKYCNQLPVPVFPTPLYELVAGLLLFGLLWSVRKRFRIPGTFFCFYLILNGIERFLIETIRVNNRLDIFGLHPTQAEVISSLLVVGGTVTWLLLRRQAGHAATAGSA
ncbi:MAG TPA: prolipoprotein diacylglyceryl transferase family protein [Chitinophagaceae bacterium]|nr:prolipoprotein diacylglyceryl transferase family protein [Chitinophagaceae bacterium]